MSEACIARKVKRVCGDCGYVQIGRTDRDGNSCELCGGYTGVEGFIDSRREVKGMYKEEIRTRETLQSAMDALDRLGKEYSIKKKVTTRKIEGSCLPGTKGEYKENIWTIEELEVRADE